MLFRSISMENLARTYAKRGYLKEGEQLGVQVLDMRKRVLGVEHPDTMKSMDNLARTYSKKGYLKEAEQLWIQVLDMKERVLGAEHPDTLRSMENLASIRESEMRQSSYMIKS